MAIPEVKESFSGVVYPVTIGKEAGVTFGGENTLPFHGFEGEIPNRPLIAYEIQDIAPEDWPETVRKVYEGVSEDPVKWAKYCVEELKAKAVALRLVGTHPDQKDRSAEEAVGVVKDVLSAVEVPLIILGSNHVEKDSEVLPKVAEAAKGYNCVIGKAQEANYKTIAAAAMANDHKLIAMSELDINLSKQLNILLTQMGFAKEKIITDPMCSALGYGLEYTYSVMERIRLAALAQNDEVMQAPMFGDVGMYVWKIKEAQAPEDSLPEWGSVEERAVLWEAMTAVGLMLSGAELFVMRHPRAVELVERFVDEMM
ncbi:MAG: acetyl-CoA decarbonylase/synthase complex subunit delta [Nitrospirae bacterium]|nr:MAG: acetyl-CoA decarbonylase/synthase complex subunit delta [Nitrospirota bacterium]